MILDVLHNLGAMSLVTLVYFLVCTRLQVSMTDLRGRIALGILLALMALLVVKIPVRVVEGATFDFRAAPAVLAAYFGGPVAGLITAAVAGAARYSVGGPAAVGGAVSPFLYAGAGWAAAAYVRRLGRRRIGAPGFMLVGLFATLCVLPAFFIGQTVPVGLMILGKLWPMLLLGNLTGVLVLALLIEETFRIWEERNELRRANLAAAEGLQAKSRFISAVSHDIRTPLNGILGSLQLLRTQVSEPADKQLVDVALRSGSYLTDLVGQILDYSKLETGAGKSTVKTFTAEQLADGIQSMFHAAATAKGLTLTVSAEGFAGRPVDGDYDHLRQVLYNLVGNAVRYTRAGAVEASVRCRELDNDRLEATFVIADTGPGIPKSEQSRVFEQFVRLADGPDSPGGSGLGLSIAKMLVEQMGGRLSLDSEVGKGTRFSFSITLSWSRRDAVAEPAVAGTDTLPAPSRKTLLVVDDNDINRDLMREALTRMGAQVELADSGAAAIDTMRRDPTRFDAVLMDIQMPDMSGDEATRTIRRTIPAAANVPVFAVTANVLPDQKASYLEAGMTGVLTKPIDFGRLAEALDELQTGTRATADSSKSAGAPPASRLFNDETLGELSKYLPGSRIASLIDEHLDRVDETVRRLQREGLLSDAGSVREIAHDLKGMAANIGLQQISQLARRLETSDSVDDRSDLVERIAEASRATRIQARQRPSVH